MQMSPLQILYDPSNAAILRIQLTKIDIDSRVEIASNEKQNYEKKRV